jgi:hypothetical protein
MYIYVPTYIAPTIYLKQNKHWTIIKLKKYDNEIWLIGRFWVFSASFSNNLILAGRSVSFVDDERDLLYVTDKPSDILFKFEISTS